MSMHGNKSRFHLRRARLMSSGLSLFLVAALAASGAGLIPTSPARADSVFTDCNGPNAANELTGDMAAGGTVTFACDGTIKLNMTIPVDNAVTLDASSHNVTISGQNAQTVFMVGMSGHLTIKHLTIAHGQGSQGGGIQTIGTVVVINSTFSHNSAVGQAGTNPGEDGLEGDGGAIYNDFGTLTVVNSTFVQNTATGGKGADGGASVCGAGAPGQGGAIYSLGDTTITVRVSNSTFSGNAAIGGNGGNTCSSSGGTGGDGNGGAIANAGSVMLVSSSTFATNTAGGGVGGVNSGMPATRANPGNPNGFTLFDASGRAGAVKIKNTILSDDGRGNNCGFAPVDSGIIGVISSLGGNLQFPDASCLGTPPTDPKLNPLADNGGPTQTTALQANSPAIDHAADCKDAENNPITTDQRGVPRPQGPQCDIGAFELGVPVASLNPGTLTFGNQPVGTSSSTQNVTVANTGFDTALKISNVAASGDFLASNPCSAINPGTSCLVSVIFVPTAHGARTGTLTIADNAGAGSQSVVLSGFGTAPSVSLSTGSLSFGDQLVGTSSAAQNVTVANTGDANLTVSSVSASSDFAVSSNGCTSAVAPSSSCAISVVFTPSGSAGVRSGSLTISDNAGGSPASQAVSLSGNATVPPPPTDTPVPPPPPPPPPPPATDTPAPPPPPPPATDTPAPPSGTAAPPSPTATRTSAHVPSPTNTPPATHSHGPTPTPRPVNTGRHGPKISVGLASARLAGGGTLTVRVATAPRAQVRLTLQVRGTRTTVTGTGKHRKRVTHSVVVYQASVHGVADKHGRFTGHLRVTYKPGRATRAVLTATARTARGSTTRTTALTIGPALRSACALPCTVAVGPAPVAVAVDRTSGHVFVANSRGNTVSVLDARSGKLLRTVPVGTFPWAIAVDARTGRAFVADKGSNSITVLDTRSGAARGSVALGGVPFAVAVGEGSGHAFVISGARVSLLDARSGHLLRSTTTGNDPSDLAVDERSGHVFVIDQSDNSVTMLDGRTGKLLHKVTLKALPWALAVDGEAGHVVVTWGNRVSVLDARTGALLHSATVGQGPQTLAVDARTGRAFVANSIDGTVSVVDTHTGVVHRTVPVGRQPHGVAADATTGRVFVANSQSNSVSVLDARTGAVRRTIKVGKGPLAVAVSDGLGRVFVVDNGGSRGAVTVLSAKG